MKSNRLLIFITKQYLYLWFFWKRLTNKKRYCLTINTPIDEVADTFYCSFCDKQLKQCACFTDIVQSFEKRKEQIAWSIAQPIFDKANKT